MTTRRRRRDGEEDETVELVWQAEAADEPPPSVPRSSRVVPSTTRDSTAATSVPAPSRADQLRLMSCTPSAWDLHRQLAEALLERGRQCRWQ